MLLTGDIGGTKTQIALFTRAGGDLVPGPQASYPSREYGSLQEVIDTFMGEHPARVTAAAFGVAGPIVGGKSTLTNLRWEIDSGSLAANLRLASVGLLNDLEAIAYGTLRLSPAEVFLLQKGTPVDRGAIAIIAAGTGLGEGALFWDGRRYRALPSEGGHSDFAPRTRLEAELLHFLGAEFGRVSYERLLSGPGLFNIYRFFRARAQEPEPAWLTRERESGDPSAAVSKAALEKKDKTCEESLDLFVSVYGAEAGNLALKFLSTAGVFVAGGIAPKILPRMVEGEFLRSFTTKGRHSPLVRSMPVAVVVDGSVGLLGAAHVAALIEDGLFL